MVRWGAPPIRILRGVVLACASVAAATGLTWLIRDGVSPGTYPLFFAAVILSAWFGGAWSGFLASLLTLPAANFFLVEPLYEFHWSGGDIGRGLLFLAASIVILVADAVRRRSEERGHERDERLHKALITGGLGTWEWDVQTSLVTWSPELERLHGLDPGTFGGNFASFLKEIHPEDSDAVREQIGHSLESGSHHIVYRIIRPDGEVRWVEGRGELERNSDGSPRRMVGVCMDVTERMEAEKALRESRGYLESAIHTARLGLCDYDLDRGDGWSSPELRAMYGLTHGRERYRIEDLYAITHPDDREQLEMAISRMFESGTPVDVEYRAVRPDNKQTRWFRAIGRRDPDERTRRFIGVVEDITERKLAQESVRASEERLRLASEAAQMGTWEWDMHSNRLSASDQTAQIHGFAPADFKGNLETYLKLIRPDDRRRVAETMVGSLENDSPEIEYRIALPDGSERWVLIKGQVLRDAAGQPERMLGVAMDITERKQAEEALRESEARMSAVLEAAVDAIITIDEKGTILSVNAACLAMFGYEESELLGQNVTILMPEPYAGEHDGYLRRYRETGEKRIIGIGRRVEARRKDGSTFPVDLAVSEVVASGMRIFTGTIRDVTERAKREAGERFLIEAGVALASSLDSEATISASVRLAVPRLADAAIVELLTEAGELERAGQAHCDPEKDLVLREISRLYPPDRKSAHPIMQALETGTTQFLPGVQEEFIRSIAQDNRHLAMMRQLASHSAIIIPMTARGSRVGVLTLILSEPGRRFEEWSVLVAEAFAQRLALAIDNARLYQRAQEVQEELREASLAKDEFLSMVSHELRTPITTIRSGVYLLRRGLDEKVGQEVVADVVGESERLELIVENLLALGRAELGQRVEPEPVSVPVLISRVVAGGRRARPGRTIEVTTDKEVPVVAGVPLYAELILRNLVDNALKYADPDTAVEVTATCADSEVLISVLDRGPGIAPEELDLIFERFYRSKQAASRTSGAGMGLTVCKRLVEAQGGRIWGAHREDGGLVVTFTLPTHNDGGEPSPPNPARTGQAPP